MTSFDWIVIAVLILSTGFAVVRGALRELGTLAALGVSAGGAFFLVKPMQSLLGFGQSFLSTVVMVAGLITAGFVLAYWLLHVGLRRVRLTGRAMTADRVGGGVFGFIRGLILIGLGFLAYSYYLDEARRPDSVKNAVTLPLAEAMSSIFEGLAPPPEDQVDKPAQKTGDSNAAVDGYDRTDRTALTEIVTTVTTDDQSAADTPVGEKSDDQIKDILTEESSHE